MPDCRGVMLNNAKTIQSVLTGVHLVPDGRSVMLGVGEHRLAARWQLVNG